MEVVLHDIDVASALVSYIEGNNIGNIVVGASNRNAITRLFVFQKKKTKIFVNCDLQLRYGFV